jgi:hypothetical protein
MAFAMGESAKRLAAAIAAVACTGAGTAVAASPPRPIVSAPSQYVEVVPTAGGGVPDGQPRQSPPGTSGPGPGSALGAVADAVSSADRLDVLVLGVALVAATGSLAAAAARRRGGSPRA